MSEKKIRGMSGSTYISETSRGGREKKYNQDGYTLYPFWKYLPGAVVRLGNFISVHKAILQCVSGYKGNEKNHVEPTDWSMFLRNWLRGNSMAENIIYSNVSGSSNSVSLKIMIYPSAHPPRIIFFFL